MQVTEIWGHEDDVIEVIHEHLSECIWEVELGQKLEAGQPHLESTWDALESDYLSVPTCW